MSIHLFELINSMTRQEKRYFRLEALAHERSGAKVYVKLFDLLCGMEMYDETILKKKLPAEHLPPLKHYLYEHILDVLARFHHEKNADAVLNSMLRKIDILYAKSLFTQGLKMIRRAKKVAARYEKFTRMLDLLEWEKNYYVATRYFGLNQEGLDKIHRDEEQLLRKIANERLSICKGLELSLIVQSKGFTADKTTLRKMDNILKAPVLRENFPHTSFKSKLYELSSKTMFYLIKGDLEKSVSYARKRIEYLERDPIIMKEEIITYIQSINNFIIICEHLNDRYDQVEEVISKLEKLPAREFKLRDNARLRLFLVYNARQCSYFVATGQFEKADAIATEVEQGLDHYKDAISDHDKLIFCYYISCLFFGKGNYTGATKWLNRIIQTHRKDTREDLQAMARIIFLLVNYEKGNDDYLLSLITSTRKYLYQKKHLFAFETLVLNTIKKIVSKKPEKQVLVKMLREFRMELEKISGESHTEQMLGYFDLRSWIESKIKGRRFSEIYKESRQGG